MTQKDKNLLLRVLCAMLLYGVKIQLKNTYHYHCDKMCNIGDFTIDEIKSIDKKGEHIKIYHNDPLDYEWYIDDIELEDVKPYLRPMSSMTEEEEKEYFGSISWQFKMEFCLKNHLDYNDLIEKGLALPAPEGMYNFK